MPRVHRATVFVRARARSAGLLGTAVLLLAACSADEPAATEGASEPSGKPSPSATSAGFTRTSDVVYMTANDTDLLLDVYTPDGEGPWPVVVAFHGLDSDGKSARDMTPVVEAAAAEGMVIFAPSWIIWNPPPFPFKWERFTGWKQAASCAVAFAQENAADYGGDAARTVAYGFSAGAGAGMVATLEPSTEPVAGCRTDAVPLPVTGAVLGEGEYFLHSENFDEAFAAAPRKMEAEVAGLTEPKNWPADLDARIFLWVADEATSPRSIDDPANQGWFDERDPDGSIRADLKALGRLEDGRVTSIDAGELMKLRLGEAGLDVTLDSYPGGHTTANKIPELVAYLKEAGE